MDIKVSFDKHVKPVIDEVDKKDGFFDNMTEFEAIDSQIKSHLYDLYNFLLTMPNEDALMAAYAAKSVGFAFFNNPEDKDNCTVDEKGDCIGKKQTFNIEYDWSGAPHAEE